MVTTEDILSRYDGKFMVLAGRLREWLLSLPGDVIEIPDQPINPVGYGYGTGYKELICTLLLSKKESKPGFYKGSELPDLQQSLTGTGKVHRYAIIRSEQDIQNPALKKLLQEAVKAYQKRNK